MSSPRSSTDGEEMLVVDERGGQHLVRQGQKRPIEEAGDDTRILDEIGDLVDQRRMIAEWHAPTELSCLRLELTHDAVATFRVIEHDEVLAETASIVVEGADLDRPAGAAAGRQESMPVGHRAGGDFLDQRARRIRRPADGKRHDPAPVEEQQPADGTSEQQLATPVVQHGVPVHLLREGQVAQQAGQQVGERIDRALPSVALASDEILTLGGLLAIQRFEGEAVLACEAEGRRGGLSRRGQCRRDRWTSDDLVEIFLALRNAADPRRQPSRRRITLDRHVRRHPHLAEARFQLLGHLPGQAGKPGCRQLLDTNFYEQFAIHRVSALDVESPALSPPRRPTSWRSRPPAGGRGECRRYARLPRCRRWSRAG